jgi:hypothetical protein
MGELSYELLEKKLQKLIKNYKNNPTKSLKLKILNIESRIDKLIEIDTQAKLKSPKDKKYTGHTSYRT